MIHHLDSDEPLNAGQTYTNAPAEGAIRLDLPAAIEEAALTVVVHAPYRILLVADGSDKICLGDAAAAQGVAADAVGSHLLLTCTKTGRWTSLYTGNWSVVAS